MTAWYGGVLVLFLVAFAAAAYVEASNVVASTTADRLDGVSTEIESYLRADASQPLGPVSVVTALADQSTLDSFVGPGLYLEVYNAAGYRVGKSTDLGDFDLPRSGLTPWHPPQKLSGTWGIAQTPTGEMLVRSSPLTSGVPGEAPVGMVEIGESLSAAQDEERRFGLRLLASLALALAAVVGISAWLARNTVSPINEIARAVAEIGDEDLAKRIGWHGRKDELGFLAGSFDAMLARLEAAFARERRLIADASHELKTPLTVINANAQMLERWAQSDEALRKEALATIRGESASMARIINAMLTLAKTDDPRALAMEPVDAAAAVKDAATALRPTAEAKGLRLEVDVDGPAWVHGEPGLLRQLATNLTENAIKFTKEGAVTVKVRRDDGHAELIVADTGPGIPSAALPHVFERFYRADPARSRHVEGTGLGLAVVRNIVRVHAGEVTVDSMEGRGTTFTVALPLLEITSDGEP